VGLPEQRYDASQRWLRRRQPAVLAIWGKNDPFFIPAGAEAYARDATDTTVVLLDTGHFALEEKPTSSTTTSTT
jgi:pimeloyl-ACP methyl ester carboxylesterase